jgi:hypothetical protein
LRGARSPIRISRMRPRWMVQLLPFFLLPALLAGVLLWPEAAAAQSAVHSELGAAACASHASISTDARAATPERGEPQLAETPPDSLHFSAVGRRMRSGVVLLVTHSSVPVVPHWTPLPSSVATAPERPEPPSLAAFCRPPPHLRS